MDVPTTEEKEFVFVCEAIKAKLITSVTIPHKTSTQEFAERLVHAHNLPCFVEAELKEKLSEFIEQETEAYYSRRYSTLLNSVRNGDSDKDATAAAWEHKFSQEVSSHSLREPVSNEGVFSEVYHSLIHSPALETLLNLEHTYALAVEGLVRQRDSELSSLHNRHREEMDDAMKKVGIGYTDEQINYLAQRHFEKTQLMESKWSSELSNLQETQKKEYREWVMKVHADTQSSDTTPAYVQRVRQLSNPGNADVNDDLLQPQRREESFTVHLGAQLKTMHNIRLISAEVLDLCRHKPNKIGGMIVPQPQRLQTAMSLYSNSLCALVLLVDNRLNSYTGIKREFASVCEQSTDFHFPTLEQQFEKISISLIEANEERAKQRAAEEDADRTSVGSATGSIGSMEREVDKSSHMKCGDFYITRHSNLSEVHLVFHQVTDDSIHSATSSDISSRHPVIMGFRNILRACFNYDVHTITLPLLLTHEMTEEMTIPWCLKRAELVFKCTKGFMMEQATWGGQESRTLQFLVPKGLSEDTFSQISTMLPSIFRMSNPVMYKSS